MRNKRYTDVDFIVDLDNNDKHRFAYLFFLNFMVMSVSNSSIDNNDEHLFAFFFFFVSWSC